MQSLDDYAHYNKLKNVNTKLKVLFAMTSLLLGVLSTSPVAPFTILLLMASLTILAAKIPAKDYLQWFSAPLLFTLPVFMVMLFFFGSDEAWFTFKVFGYPLTVYRDGFNLGLLVVSRVLSGTSCLYFLAFTTPMVELFSILQLLRVPAIFIELMMMIYRYIFVILEEAGSMRHAQKMRLGYSGFKRSLDSVSLLASNLFIRAWDRGEKLYIAMNSRCYDGRINLLERDEALPILPLLGLLALESAIAAIAYFTRDYNLL
jgi:cobalt/nickel transport system permease protein